MSRSGSHAGRGFRYQDAAGVWLAVRCWAGELPYGEVVPEGQDDYELRGVARAALVQAKSRRDHLGYFPTGEAAGFVRELWARSKTASPRSDELILLLERPVAEGPTTNCQLSEHPGLSASLRSDPEWPALASRTQLWIADAPLEAALETIARMLPCIPLAAQVHYGELLSHIGNLADANGMRQVGRFEGLAVADVETTFRRLEPLLDPAGMETALRDGHCDPVDFLTPMDDPAFYLGVDARPGHLAGGLVAERPEARRSVLDALRAHGAALVVGQSGAGKSALMWEAARAARHTTRWFEVKRGHAQDAHLLIRLARALRASAAAPVGFVLDDVGNRLLGLWDELLREAQPGSGIIVLGSIREEDVFLLPSRARAGEVRPTVDVGVAERIWRRLRDQGQSSWVGWREPWDRSGGLLLEYTHILTQGDRLEAVLGEQVDRRLREGRDTELAILQVTALAGAARATIDIGALPKALGVASGDLSRALRRLVDEHLVAAPVEGQLSGLHQLRSMALFDLAHARPPPTPADTITCVVRAITAASLEAVATHVLTQRPGDRTALLTAVAARVEEDCDPVATSAAMAGLGQAHVETTLRAWLSEALLAGLEPTQVTLAVMLAMAGTDLASLPFPEPLRAAVRALRTRSTSDPRLDLFSVISADALRAIVVAADAAQLRALLGALIGVDVPADLQTALRSARPDFDRLTLSESADLIGAARLIDQQIAMAWTGTDVRDRLLARVAIEVPWAGSVQPEVAPEGRLLRGLLYHVAPSVQTDVHGEVVELCQLLLGLDPDAEVVAVDAVAANGLPSGLPGFPLAAKRIPRGNLPTPALPQWNRRWVSTAARLIGAESHTDYLQRARELLAQMVPTLEHVFDSIVRGGKSPQPQVLQRLGEVHEAVRSLTAPRDTWAAEPVSMASAIPLQSLLFSCSADLVRRFARLPEGHNSFVVWCGDLLKNVREARDEPWELVGTCPDDELRQLENLIAALRLLAGEAGARHAQPTRLWTPVTRDAKRGNALRRAKVSAEGELQSRSARLLRNVEAGLAGAGLELELHARPDWGQPLPWPPLEFLALVDLESSDDWSAWIAEHGPRVRAVVGEGRRIQLVPRIFGIAVPRLIVGGVGTLLPSPNAAADWLEALGLRCLDDVLTRAAQAALDLLIELDGLRHFELGVESRPLVEQSVRADDGWRLAGALRTFENLAEGTAVQFLLRSLSDEVEAGDIALAEGIAESLQGRTTAAAQALADVAAALLAEDIAAARAVSK